MADVSRMTPLQLRQALRELYLVRGFSLAEANAQIAFLRTDTAIRDDLAFHRREDDAIKAGQPLPMSELLAHYTGPMHRLPPDRSEEIANDQQALPSPSRTPESVMPPLTAGVTPRQVVMGVLGIAVLATFVYVGVASTEPPPDWRGRARS